MRMSAKDKRSREHRFALILMGTGQLSQDVHAALSDAGCSDASLTLKHGLVYLQFTRQAESLKTAILCAIRSVRDAGIGAQVLRIDECNLVTASDIARKIGRSRQLVYQYINGHRGSGDFPPPEFHLSDHAPLWCWCTVSNWLVQNNFLPAEESCNAQVVTAINQVLQTRRLQQQNPKLFKEVTRELQVK